MRTYLECSDCYSNWLNQTDAGWSLCSDCYSKAEADEERFWKEAEAKQKTLAEDS